MSTDSCPNCGAASTGRFCPSCGQDNARRRLGARELVSDTLENLTGWDSALGRTLRGLVADPGGLVSDYVAGRRRRYVNPVRFCLLALALWFVLARATDHDVIRSAGIQFEISGESETVEAVEAGVREFLGQSMNVLLFLFLPVLALFLRFAFRRSERNLAECTALVLFLAGFEFLFESLLLPLVIVDPRLPTLGRALVSLVWTVRAARGFFGVSLWAATWRSVVCLFGHTLATLVLAGAIAIPWVLLTSG